MRGGILHAEAFERAEKLRKAKAFNEFMATRRFPALNNMNNQSTEKDDKNVVFVLQPKGRPAGRSGGSVAAAAGGVVPRRRRRGREEGERIDNHAAAPTTTISGHGLPNGTSSLRHVSETPPHYQQQQQQPAINDCDNSGDNKNKKKEIKKKTDDNKSGTLISSTGKKTRRSQLGLRLNQTIEPTTISALQQFRMTVLLRLKRENKKASHGISGFSASNTINNDLASDGTLVDSLPASPRSPRSPRSSVGSRSPRSRVLHSKAFSPCNPEKAKRSIRRRGKEAFLGGKHVDVRDVDRKHAQISRNKFLAGDFKPSSSSKAKRGIEVSYYLNSADEAALQAERQYMKQKAKKNLKAFLQKLTSETKHGHKVMENKSQQVIGGPLRGGDKGEDEYHNHEDGGQTSMSPRSNDI